MGMGEAIQEGTQVREGQEILTIPSTGGMIAEASIHESVLNQVAIDLPCTIAVDAIPSQQFKGRVRFVAPLPDKGNWWANPNQRLYRTEVSIEDASPEMRPGMNCSIEILAEEIPDALYVPLQAVFMQAGDTIAFVDTGVRPEQRSVKVGKSSEKWVQILAGLAAGESVLLTLPAGFSLEASQENRPLDTPVPAVRTPPTAQDRSAAPEARGAAGDERPNRPGGDRERRSASRADGSTAGRPPQGAGARERGESESKPAGDAASKPAEAPAQSSPAHSSNEKPPSRG